MKLWNQTHNLIGALLKETQEIIQHLFKGNRWGVFLKVVIFSISKFYSPQNILKLTKLIPVVADTTKD